MNTHFSRKHTFHESYKWTEHKIMVLNLANKNKIIRQCHNFENILMDDIPASSNSLSSKSFVRIMFYGADNNKLQKRDN